MLRVDGFFFGFFVVSLGMGNSKGSDSEVFLSNCLIGCYPCTFCRDAICHTIANMSCVFFMIYTHKIHVYIYIWYIYLHLVDFMVKRLNVCVCIYHPWIDPMGFLYLQGAAGLYGMGHLV